MKTKLFEHKVHTKLKEEAEFFDKGDNQKYWYFTRHGVSPGCVPRGIEILDVISTPKGDFFLTNKVLTTKSLDKYEIEERKPSDIEESFTALSNSAKDKLSSDKYIDLVDEVFKEYELKRDKIHRGFIDKETYDWLVDKFDLVNKEPAEIDLLWKTINAYFYDLLINETSDKWRHDISVEDFSFLMDTDSAWKEALNNFSRGRRGEYDAFYESK